MKKINFVLFLFPLLCTLMSGCSSGNIKKTKGLEVVELQSQQNSEKLKINSESNQFVGPLPEAGRSTITEQQNPEPVVALLLMPSIDEHYPGLIGALNGYESTGMKGHIISSFGPISAVGLLYAESVNAKEAEWEFFKFLGQSRSNKLDTLEKLCQKLSESRQYENRSIQQLPKLFYLAQPSVILQETEISTRGNIKDILTSECLRSVKIPFNYKSWIRGLVQLGADIVVVIGPRLSKDEQDMLNLDLEETQTKNLGDNNLVYFISLKSLEGKKINIQKMMSIQKKHVLKKAKDLRNLINKWKQSELKELKR
jgi:hypothetical protein